MNRIIDRIEWQSCLFPAGIPQRARLSALAPTWPCTSRQIRIHRNHSFEYVATIAQPYLAYAGWRGEFIYSDYDDSLSWATVDGSQSVDLEIVWLDFDRYMNSFTIADLVNWLVDRLSQLRKLTIAPILVANWGIELAGVIDFDRQLAEQIDKLVGVYLFDRSSAVRALGDRYFDLRAAKLTGTNISDRGCILHGRELACRWLPALFSPRIKAIVVDLDNTLYAGVLGEDGIDGVRLTSAHQSLQLELVRLQQTGIFLAIVSRNELADVEQLFNTRSDFPLQLAHFSDYEINWQDKGVNIQLIADRLRIATDAILFIDDNPGELIAVAQHHPQMPSICATNAAETWHTLTWYPGIWSAEISEADRLRVADLKLAKERDRTLQTSTDIWAYLQNLQVKLTFSIDPLDRLPRLGELAQKTNQFNLNLQRSTELMLASAMQSPTDCVVSIELEDRLCQAGIIGLVVGNYRQTELVVTEVCISCRALGRKLEDIMLLQAIKTIAARRSIDLVSICYQHGDRNAPGLNWLQGHTDETLDSRMGIVRLRPESLELDFSQYPVNLVVLTLNS
jgi:FkbH-like protein